VQCLRNGLESRALTNIVCSRRELWNEPDGFWESTPSNWSVVAPQYAALANAVGAAVRADPRTKDEILVRKKLFNFHVYFCQYLMELTKKCCIFV
jgi:hypothetical protein